MFCTIKDYAVVCLIAMMCVNRVTSLTQAEMNELCQGKNFVGVADNTNVNKYVVCINNLGYEMACAAGKCFDELQQECNEDTCPVNGPPAGAYTDKVKVICQNGAPLGTFLPAEKCGFFYICAGATTDPLYTACPSGMHFSRIEGRCMPVHEAQCDNAPPAVPTCSLLENGQYKPHSVCTKFYVCINSIAFEAECEPGYKFDPANQICVRGTC